MIGHFFNKLRGTYSYILFNYILFRNGKERKVVISNENMCQIINSKMELYSEEALVE